MTQSNVWVFSFIHEGYNSYYERKVNYYVKH
nr:MAG TPA: hypothetical protein [Caudoviricetes sp.]